MGVLKRFFLILIVVVLCGISFFIGKYLDKEKDENNNREPNKTESNNSPEIVIEGVWKAMHVEIGEENLGKEYYVIFQKGGKVIEIDEDGVRYGTYSDTGKSEETNFALQIEDDPISFCKYENDSIQCLLYGFVEKMK
ncbi:MAG: hypothetical protein K2I70_01975 [Bacilli bacterium]|nr:hypothetical protein [Bacilli bacterium]